MPKSPLRSKKLALIAVTLIIATGVALLTWQLWGNSNSLVDGQKSTSQTTKLRANINTFMELQVTNNPIAKEITRGSDNYHCSNHLYGYDSKYAYSWVFCSGYVGEEFEQGSGYSVPTRFEYTQPDFTIVSFKQPGDGTLYGSELRELFPKQYVDMALNRSPSGPIADLEKEVKTKAGIK